MQEAEKPAFGLSAMQFVRDELDRRGGSVEKPSPEPRAVYQQEEDGELGHVEMCSVTAYDQETGETYRCGLPKHGSNTRHTKGEKL